MWPMTQKRSVRASLVALVALALASACDSGKRQDGPNIDGTTSISTEAASAKASAKSSASASPAAADDAPWAKAVTRSFEVRMGDKKLGDVTMEWQASPDGTFRMRSKTVFAVMTGEIQKHESRTESDETEVYDKNLELVRADKVKHEETVNESELLEVKGKVIHAKVEKPSHKEEKDVDIPADFHTEMAVFRDLRRQALAGATLPLEQRYSDFESDDMAFVKHRIKLIQKTKLETPSGTVEGWKVESTNEKDGETITSVVDDAGLPLRGDFGPLSIVIAGTAGGGGGMAVVDSHLPVEGGFAGSVKELSVVVTVKGDGDANPPPFVDSPYQTVKRNGEVYTLALHGREGSPGLTPPSLPMKDLPADVAKFLKSTADSQSDAPTVVKKAKEIVGAERDSRAAAKAIIAWAYKNLAKRDGTRGTASAVETLESGGGDCTEHAALTVALARAAGIPARNAGGIVLVEGSSAQAGYHAWTEVWLGEWVALDAALGRLEVGPRYIWLGYSEPGEPDEGAKMVRLLGRTSIAIAK